MGLKDANEVFDKVVDKTEQMDQLTGVLPDLSSDLLSKTKKAQTFLNKAEKAHGEKRLGHMNTAAKAVEKASDVMRSLGEEAEKIARLTEEIGDLYGESQDAMFE